MVLRLSVTGAGESSEYSFIWINNAAGGSFYFRVLSLVGTGATSLGLYSMMTEFYRNEPGL